MCLSVCPLVCLSQAETTERIELVYGRDTYANPTLCYEESPHQKYAHCHLDSGLTASQWRCQQNLSTVELVVDRITL